MWIALALMSAVTGAGTSLLLKRAVAHGGAVLSIVTLRAVAGVLLAGVVLVAGGAPEPTPGYWRALAMVMPPEVIGMLCMSLALRAGELSLVQPIFGLIPLFVMAIGTVLLGEYPTPLAGAGVLFVAAGVYTVGLRAGMSALEPIRALARSRASWYAVVASVAWGFTGAIHKLGIAEIGPIPWAATLALGSALALAMALPVVARRFGRVGVPARGAPWMWLVLVGGLVFAVQQIGLHLALRAAPAAYVTALTATSIIIATAFGVVVLGEREGARARIAGAVMVSAGAVMIALFG